MGLASEMRWPHSRNGSTPHQAVDGPAALPIRVSDEWAVNDEYWAILMLRVGALVIIVFQSGYLLNELESLDYWPATSRSTGCDARAHAYSKSWAGSCAR